MGGANNNLCAMHRTCFSLAQDMVLGNNEHNAKRPVRAKVIDYQYFCTYRALPLLV